MLGHLGTLVPCQGLAQLSQQRQHGISDRFSDRLGPMAGQCWPVLLPCCSVLCHAGRCNSMVKRVLRSTSVPIAELPRPIIKNPSQDSNTQLKMPTKYRV